MHPKPEGGYTRVIPTKTKPPPEPGHADTLKPSASEALERKEERMQQTSRWGEEVHASDLQDDPKEVMSQHEMVSSGEPDATRGGVTPEVRRSSPDSVPEDAEADVDYWEPKPPKVLMQDPNVTPWELRAQIQLYATTEYVSWRLFLTTVLTKNTGNCLTRLSLPFFNRP